VTGAGGVADRPTSLSGCSTLVSHCADWLGGQVVTAVGGPQPWVNS